MSGDPPFSEPAVAAAFNAYPARLRAPLLRLRRLIFETAAATEGVGTLVETLKWGQPAYLTERPRTGSTIRLGTVKGHDDGYALFVHCQSRLIPAFRELYQGDLAFDGNRAVTFSAEQALSEEIVRHCIALALTYHARKR